MQGQILVFNEQKQTGAIVASNGQRFSFEIGHWHDVVTPERGMSVDFSLDENNQIQQIRLALPGTNFRAGQTASWPQRPKRDFWRTPFLYGRLGLGTGAICRISLSLDTLYFIAAPFGRTVISHIIRVDLGRGHSLHLDE